MSTDDVAPGGADDRLRRVEAVTDAGLAQLDVDELLEELLERVRELLAVDTAAVLLLDSSRRFLVATAARGFEEEVRQGVRIPLGKGFAGRIAAEKRAVIIEKVDHSNVLNPILREKGIRFAARRAAAGRRRGARACCTSERCRPVVLRGGHGLLQLVADRVALAVDARSSQAERAAATALQRSLLPTELPDRRGLRVRRPLRARRRRRGRRGLVRRVHASRPDRCASSSATSSVVAARRGRDGAAAHAMRAYTARHRRSGRAARPARPAGAPVRARGHGHRPVRDRRPLR